MMREFSKYEILHQCRDKIKLISIQTDGCRHMYRMEKIRTRNQMLVAKCIFGICQLVFNPSETQSYLDYMTQMERL